MKRLLSILLILALAMSIILIGPFGLTANAVSPGDIIALKAYANGKLVCAANAGANPLIASSNSVGSWEKFQVVDAGSGKIALQASVNNKYVCAENGGSDPLIANRTAFGLWETFELVNTSDGKVALKAMANNKYVCAENVGNDPLKARSDSIGVWEKFDMIVNPTDGTKCGYVGVTLGFSKRTLQGGPYTNEQNTIYNLPMFKATSNESKFWDSIVEELITSGVDYVAPTIRGYLNPDPTGTANDGGDTRKLADLVTAINKRGVGDKLKISCLDDNPASWTDKKNIDKHSTGGYSPKFDISDANSTGEGGYKYVWDNNYRAFFNAVPDNLRFKLDGRPVIFIWAIGDYAFSNMGNGKSKDLLMYVRQRCQAEFGFNPFIIVDHTWLDNDPACNDSNVVDAVHAWFLVDGSTPGWSTYTFNGRKVGVCVPEFRFVSGDTSMIIDPNHGQTFINNMNNTKGSGCLVTLIEGFSDWEENAAVWRAKEGTYSTTHYDYPNQRINILRKYTNNLFPTNLKIEAESCDSYYDTSSGNQWGIYRDGNIDVEDCLDTGDGWDVGAIAAGEWLEWSEVPLQGTVTLKVRVATINSGKRLRFVIDGNAGSTITIPNTGGWQTWQTVDAGTFNLAQNSYHTVRLELLDNDFNVNYWTN